MNLSALKAPQNTKKLTKLRGEKMMRRSKGHAVVEVMNVDREIRMALVKLVDALSFHNNDEIDLDKVKAQFKEMTNRALRDFDQDMLTFPTAYDSERPVERRIYNR